MATEVEKSEFEPTEQEVLLSLARLDLEAALAYEVCAEQADDEDVERNLLKFRDDHMRHVEALNEAITARGGRALESSQAGKLLEGIAKVAASLGTDAGLLAMLANEDVTTGTYALVLELKWDDKTNRMLERHAADEQHHFDWISDKLEKMGELEAPPSELQS